MSAEKLNLQLGNPFRFYSHDSSLTYLQVALVAAAAAAAAAAAYLDARYLIRHDLDSTALAAAVLNYVREQTAKDRLLTYHVLEDHALRKPDHVLLLFEDRTWTYKQFFDDLQRVGNWLMKDLGIEKGELVAIVGQNSPEYLMLWFALDAVGAVPAFINCNLTKQPLVHCVKIAGSRFLLAETDRRQLVQPCEEELRGAGVETVYYDAQSISLLSDSTPIPRSRNTGIRPSDIRSLVYTSGTTGMPKATIVTTGRYLRTGRASAEHPKLKPTDRLYTAMPLFHIAAQAIVVTSVQAGSTLVISRKFSHQTFWPEVRASKANIIQYVGEMCRYLLNAPPSPLDQEHNVYMATGLGMRPDVWEAFRERFGIPVINEIYAASDSIGTVSNMNKGEFSRNAIGVRGPIWHYGNGQNEVRVKIDAVTGNIVKDTKGFALKCGVDEPGEALYRMDPATAQTVFPGYYKDKYATEKRKIYDVFEKGDM